MLLIYLVVFILFYITSGASKKPTFKLLLLIYLASIISACLIWYLEPGKTRRYDLYLPGIIYHVIVLVVMMLPLRRFDRIIAPNRITIGYETMRPFFIVLIILSIISILSSFVTYSLILSSGVSIRDGRMMSVAGESFVRIVKPHGSFLAHVSTIASEFSYLAFFFAFLVACKHPGHQGMVRALLLSSLTAIFFQLEWFGRENIIRFFLDGAIVWVMFRPIMPDSFKKTIKKALAIFVVIFGTLFTVITIERFSVETGNESGAFYSVLSYFGQGFFYFSPIYKAYEGFSGRTDGRTIFAVFFPDAEKGSIFNTAESYTGSLDIPHNVFGTYVCSFVSDLGSYPAIIPFVLLVIFSLIVSRMRSDNVFTYIYILWIYRFFTQGVFYWVDILNSGDRLLCFFLIVVLNFLYNNKRSQLTYI